MSSQGEGWKRTEGGRREKGGKGGEERMGGRRTHGVGRRRKEMNETVSARKKMEDGRKEELIVGKGEEE